MAQTSSTMQTKTNPIKWVPSVYFGMGLPYVALSLMSVLMFAHLGVGAQDITFWTSLLVLPWSLKPLFSIVMEVMGTKRQYLYISEIITSLMFGAMCFALPLSNFFAVSLACMGVLAISGSMHDIAGDGLYMQELTTKEQGQYAGWQGAFYNLAKILTNGGLVFLAGNLSGIVGVKISWLIIMGICATIMLLLGVYHFFALPKEQTLRPTTNLDEGLKELLEVFSSFFRKKYIWLYLVFIFLYRTSEGLAMKIAPIFLTAARDVGGIQLSNEEYGLIYGTAGNIAFILGSILSGYVISKIGLRRALFALVCIFNIPFGVYLLLALYQPESLMWVSVGIIFEYFSYGFGFVGLPLFMMQQIAPGKYQMAHYAFANSLMNLSVMVPGMISGYLSEQLGYLTFFTVVMFTTVPAIAMAFILPFAHRDDEQRA